jgi:TolB-like protein/class 3 adenylate cyclase/Flp pilus assembly protein TadD
MERRLAAVLIADVVGYVRLSQADEEGTRARFQADQREVFEPAIAAHHGRLVKTMGDALLVEFHSVVDAVRCAVEVQRLKAERNAGTPGAGRLVYRIGINLGDVIVEGDDIHGDGVNIADRLQELADPGGITVSGTAYDQFKTKVEVGYAYLGEQRVKHVADPVRVYRVLMDAAAAGKTIHTAASRWRSWRWPAFAAALAVVVAGGVVAWALLREPKIEAAAVERMALPLPDKPSIIVLPFANMSGDPQQDYFADGMTEDLTTDLSRISGLFVISRNTAFTYKGKAVKPAQVAEELGVRYILEGSVRRGGDQIRINAQLIDALSGGHKWADRYDGSAADIFALQDKVTNAIVDALALRITDADERSLRRQGTTVPAAYDAFLRGWESYRRTTPQDYKEAIPLLEEAVRLDPNYADAYGTLAMIYYRTAFREWYAALGIAGVEAKDKAEKYLEAAQKQPTAIAHQVAGLGLLEQGAYISAIAEFKEAIALEPGDSWSYVHMAIGLAAAGRPDEAIAHINTAMRLDPHPPPVFLYYLGLAQFSARRFNEAAASLEQATKLGPDYEAAFLLLGATYGQLGRTQEAASAVARYDAIRVQRGFIPVTLESADSYLYGAPRELVREGLRIAGVPGYLGKSEFARRNTLTPDEVRTILFGHRANGRDGWTGKTYAASIAADGTAKFTGDWNLIVASDGIVTFEDDEFCYTWSGNIKVCGPMLRNPGGTPANENEFIWYSNRGTYTFSLAK